MSIHVCPLKSCMSCTQLVNAMKIYYVKCSFVTEERYLFHGHAGIFSHLWGLLYMAYAWSLSNYSCRICVPQWPDLVRLPLLLHILKNITIMMIWESLHLVNEYTTYNQGYFSFHFGRHNYNCFALFTTTTLLNRLYGEWTHPCWYLFPLEFTLYFPVYGLYCYFWHDCTPISDSTWCRNIRIMKNIAYHNKHGLWSVLPQYMKYCH